MNKLEQYWMGKPPSTREMVEDYVNTPKVSYREMSIKHNKSTKTVEVHVRALKDLGILVQVGVEKRSWAPSKPVYWWRLDA